MATAPAHDQITLLDVAELDRQIARLGREDAKHPLRAELGALINAAAARARDRDAAAEAVAAAEGRLASAEETSASLRGQIERKERSSTPGRA